MPVVLPVLACAVFAQATSEFMLAGLVAAIAAAFGIPVATAGWCTSAFAVGMVLGAPVTALWAGRFPPRTALVAFLAAFVAVHVVGALTPSFPVLLVSRLVAALANAGFLAVALGVAARSVPPERTARATGVLLAGTTVALIVGVPAGALLGQALGWRSTFWVVAALAGVALLGVLTIRVPARVGDERSAVAGEVRVLRRRPVALTLMVAVLVNAGTFAVYTFLGPLLSGAGGALVPVALAVFGVGAFVGVTVAARVADTHYRWLLLGGGMALPAVWAALALLAAGSAGPATAIGAVAVAGTVAFAVGSGLIARSLSLVGDAPTLGGSYPTVALNLGATLGPVLGGAGLAFGPAGPAWVAAGLAVVAAVPALASLAR